MKVLCLWELGGNLGHVNNLAAITKELIEHGFEVTVALRQLRYAPDAFGDLPVTLLQSPLWQASPVIRAPTNMADILSGVGYAEKAGLAGLVSAWRGIYETVRPDIVIYDYAPTALLAGRDKSFKKIVTGIGFGELVPGMPAISLLPGDHAHDSSITGKEKSVIGVMNQVGSQYGFAPIRYIGDLYEADKTVIAFARELDMYADHRTKVEYCLPASNKSNYPRVSWSSTRKCTVFVYVKAGIPVVEPILQGLVEAKLTVLVYLRGGGQQQIQRYRQLGVGVIETQVELNSAISGADYVVAHGGNTVLQALLQGKPVLAVPTQLEQMNTAWLIERNQLGCSIRPEFTAGQIKAKVLELINRAELKANAKNLANKYTSESDRTCEKVIARYCVGFR